MRKIVTAAAVAAVFAVSSMSAHAAAEPWKDYTLSKEVSDVTFIKVKPNKMGDYLAGIKQTWWPSCEIGKKLGSVTGCAIYMSETNDQDFNLILVITHPSAAFTDPNEEMYNKFMAEMRAKLAEDKQDKIVEGYSEMRSFYGEKFFRKLTFK